MGQQRPLFHVFLSFQTHIQFSQQINVKNVLQVYSDGIQTRDLWNMSLLPIPLDRGSRHRLLL